MTNLQLDNDPPDPAAEALAKPCLSETVLQRLSYLGHLASRLWTKIRWNRVVLFIFSLSLFMLAINFMKEGALGLAPLVRDTLRVTNPVNSLGFGWLFAYIVMSGSPVAAASLAFFHGGVIDKMEAFTMIAGSRFGASFIVLFIGFLYVLRGRDRATSLSMGLLSLIVTMTTYLVGLALGLTLLQTRALDFLQPTSTATLSSLIDLLLDPLVNLLADHIPRWGLFIVGFGTIMVSFNLFDKCLPQMALKESQVGRVSRLVYRPWVMFILGAGITLISMSVSVSLSVLVPLSNRGFVRRENVIPYIMGANITTFIDTLFAAILLSNPAAFTVVFVEMVSVSIVSIIILTTCYRLYERSILASVHWVVARRRNLFFFMVMILIIPAFLMFF